MSKVTAEQINDALKKQFSQQLAKSQKMEPEHVPAGWFTVAELSEETGMSYCTTSERVRRMLKRGQVERKDFSIQLEQRVRPTPHYRLKAK